MLFGFSMPVQTPDTGCPPSVPNAVPQSGLFSQDFPILSPDPDTQILPLSSRDNDPARCSPYGAPPRYWYGACCPNCVSGASIKAGCPFGQLAGSPGSPPPSPPCPTTPPRRLGAVIRERGG